jgi:phage head maturation protease
VRRIVDLDLWEISIVTFPLLAGARVRAVKASVSSPPKASYARARAEREWSAMRGAALPPAPVRRSLRSVGSA